MRTNRAMLAVGWLLYALLASCSKSRAPSAVDEMSQVGAGTGAGTGTGTGTGSAAAGASGAGAAGRAGDGAANGGASGTEPPGSSCGAPWYRCNDACRGQLILQGATRTFGECAGDCSFTLELRTAIVLDAGDCVGVFAMLTVQNTDGSRRTYEGALTEAAWERATLLSIDLAAARAGIPDVSGCPDCADGGAAAVVIRGLDQLSQTLAYEYGNPPAALAAADEFLQALIDELLACEGTLLESCRPLDVEPDPDVPPDTPPACAFVYSSSMSAVSCAIPLDAARPCALAVECLCRSEVLPEAPMDVDACVASWLTLRGAITFTDVCTPGQTDLTRTLASALASFASAYDDTVTTTPECDVVSAYY